MTKIVQLKWHDNRTFVAKNEVGNEVKIGHEIGGLGPSELLLAALGGCVSVTAIGVLEKMRQHVTAYEVEVQGEQMSDWPKSFIAYHIVLRVWGHNIDPMAVERAFELAETRYCTVSGSLKGPITHEIQFFSESEAAPA